MRAASVTVKPGLFDGEEPTEPDGYMSTPEASALYAAILDTEAKAAELSRALGEGFALDVELAAREMATAWHKALGALTAAFADSGAAASASVSVALVALKIGRRLIAELLYHARSTPSATTHPRLYDSLCMLGEDVEAEFAETMTFIEKPCPARYAEGMHAAKETMRSR